jgi:hypothetical protein
LFDVQGANGASNFVQVKEEDISKNDKSQVFLEQNKFA